MIFSHSTGHRLRLRAVAALSKDELPGYASHRDGVIGIISSTQPGNVWVQNEEPAEPEEGDVWLTCGAKSSAPIVKDYLTVYPTAAKQYQNGAWVGVSCYVRKNDEWIALGIVLYHNGDFAVPVTGGWEGSTYAAASVTLEASLNGVAGSNGESAMRLTASQNYDHTKTGTAAVFTKMKIPVGAYNRLHVRFFNLNDGGRTCVGLSNIQDANAPEMKAVWLNYQGEYQYIEATVDLSTVDERTEAYVKIFVEAPGNDATQAIYVTDVYLTN